MSLEAASELNEARPRARRDWFRQAYAGLAGRHEVEAALPTSTRRGNATSGMTHPPPACLPLSYCRSVRWRQRRRVPRLPASVTSTSAANSASLRAGERIERPEGRDSSLWERDAPQRGACRRTAPLST
jgi:hypothetical protein